MKKRLKINGIIVAIAVLMAVAFPTVFLRRNLYGDIFDEIIEIFGVVLILLGQIFRASGRGYKSEHSQEGNILIQDGPYSLVRNPMYLGILLIALGIVLMLFKWWVTAIVLALFIIRYMLLINKEDKKLSQVFGEEYASYKRKVPCLLPSVKTLLKKDISEYLPLKLAWLKKEIGTILAVLLLTLFVESWEDILNEGLRLYLKESLAIIITVVLFFMFVIYLSKRTSYLAQNGTDKSKNTL